MEEDKPIDDLLIKLEGKGEKEKPGGSDKRRRARSSYNPKKRTKKETSTVQGRAINRPS